MTPNAITSKAIFLVEDDKDDQEFFIETLVDLNNIHLFGICNNGQEALSRLRDTPILPSLIFMDINMPLMNGIECLTAIMNDPKLKAIPVVILSSDTSHLQSAADMGAKAFIDKSQSSKSLKESVKKYIEMEFKDYALPANA